MQKQIERIYCQKCDAELDKTNNGPNCYTVHHIWPKRFYKGNGPTAILCRSCHDVLEKIIRYAEGDGKYDLGSIAYEMLQRNFMERYKNA